MVCDVTDPQLECSTIFIFRSGANYLVGGYISFPVFEEFGEYKSDDERDGGSPPPRKR